MPSLSEFERLFLLEFYVDYVTIQNISFNYAESTLCVSFQFLHYPVMRVCEEDFSPKRDASTEQDSKIVFKTGKSCLFSVHPDENNKISSSFNLVIAVCQKMKGCDKRALIGQAAVDLGNSFLNLLKSPLEKGPADKDGCAIQDVFPLKDKFKRVVGGVAAYASLSNCGKVIVTQMQLGDAEKKDYMFQGTDQSKLFKDDPMMNFPTIEREQRASSAKSGDARRISKPKERLPCKEIPESPAETDASSDSDDSDETDSENEEEIEEKEVDKTKDEQYSEIDAEINGHSITIRVIKKKPPKAEPPPPPCCCPPPEPPICPNAPKLNVCDCDFPLPPELIPRCPPQCCCPPQTGTSPPPYPPMPDLKLLPLPYPPQPDLQLPPPPSNVDAELAQISTTNMVPDIEGVGLNPEQNNASSSLLPVCQREDCPLGLYVPIPPTDPMDLEPGCVAMKGDQVFFQMTNRPAGEPVNEKEKKIANSVYYTVGAQEGGKETMGNVVQISPQSAAEPFSENVGAVGGPVSGLPLDSKQDMFLFKILQQNDNISAKSKLEMELRTPKDPYPKPPATEAETQYLVTDFPPVEKKGKGKGKGGKDKGKGKKGKK